jgi:hypothetical protein
MSDKKHIDRLFQEKFKDFNETPNPEVWANIEKQLASNKTTSSSFPLWAKLGSVAAVLVLFVSLGFVYFNNSNNSNRTIVSSEIEQNKASKDEMMTNASTEKNSIKNSDIETNLNSENNLTTEANSISSNESLNNKSNMVGDLVTNSNQTSENKSSKSSLNNKNSNTTISLKPTNLITHTNQNSKNKSLVVNKDSNSIINSKNTNETTNLVNSNSSVNKTSANNYRDKSNKGINNNRSTTNNILSSNNGEDNTAVVSSTKDKNSNNLIKNVESNGSLNSSNKTNNSLQNNSNSNLVKTSNSDKSISVTSIYKDKNSNKNGINTSEYNVTKIDKFTEHSFLNTITQPLVEIKTDSIFTNLLGLKNTKPIEAAIAENEELLEKEAIGNRWAISPTIAPVYYNSFGTGSQFHDQFVNNNKSGETNTSYGITVGYALNKKFKIRTGIHQLNLSYDTDDVFVFESVSNTPNENPLRNITFSNQINTQGISVISSSSLAAQQISPTINDNFNAALSQRIQYIEVPVELEYRLSNKKFGVNIIGGFSSFILSDNQVVSEFEGNNTELGKANNINNLSFSTNLGIGLNYSFSKSFVYNFEPTFKYQINGFSNTSGDFNPYIIGVYTGFSYKF